ncbi:MAG: DUF1622 domain-containing protein [Paracoccaceae bacterium]
MGSLWETESAEGVLHGPLAPVVAVLEWAAALIELFAILLLLIGAIRFVAGVASAELTRGAARVQRTNRERIELGRYILAGLELFIVSDVIHAALSLALADLVFLLLLVVIRAILSWFLERELAHLDPDMRT